MSLSVRPGWRTGLGNLTREIARGGIAGILAGLLVAGVGGRIAMRVSAIIDPSARGFRTEGGATVGEVTLAGTLELVIFAGLFGGIFLAVIWVIVRPWLPNHGVARHGAAGIVGVAMLARGAVEGRNRDFFILDPPVAQAAIFIMLAAVAGLVVLAMPAEPLTPFRRTMAGHVVANVPSSVLLVPIPERK